MAVVTSKKKDSKYAHLKKVYDGQEKELVVEKTDEKVTFKKEEIKIKRKEILRNIGILAFMFLLASAGYLIARFVK